MSDSKAPSHGTIEWIDLTVEGAEAVRNFYAQVVGWKPEAVQMDGYEDYSMIPPGGDQAVAGVCHARGVNSEIPPQWMVYITVEDLDTAMARCTTLGGEIVRPEGKAGPWGRFCVIRDPAGAVSALYEPARPE